VQVRLSVAEHLAAQYLDLDIPTAVLALPERSRTTGDVAAAGELRRQVRSAPGVDVVHAHGFRSCALATLALRALRQRPTLVTTWYDLALPTGSRGLTVRAAERLIARSADVTLATSTELQARARDLGARDVRLVPVAPGSEGDSGRDRAELRRSFAAQFGVREDRPWVLVVGRLVPERSGLLLTVAERWNVLYPPPEVLAVGEGPPGVVSSLRHAVESRGLPVRLLGARDDTVDLMRASDVLVTTSRWESRPIAVRQAMQAGLPVVASRLAGISELVADTGVLVDADDVEALAGEVAALLSDPERAERLARRALRRVGTFPTEDEVADTIAGVYRTVVTSRRGVIAR
jgi:glycosyltransferase involved in cell wall biosynthesis